jgi:hypothetical protein
MDSHEVLRAAVDTVGAKKVAHDLKVSSSLVYKWCQEQDESSGARNPLDRIQGIVECTDSTAPVEWLCRQAGGYFVPDPAVELSNFDAKYVQHTQRMLQNFSDLLRVISESMLNDGSVDDAEAERIRSEWDRLKAYAETFVSACEQGLFDGEETEGGC